MKQAIYWVAKHIGIFTLCRHITRKDIRILAYHGIWLGEGHFGNFLYMSPAKFVARMQKLKQMKVAVISLEESLALQEEGRLPDFPTVITVDDGWYGTYVHMLPEFERHGFPATVYVTSYYSDKQLPVLNVVVQYMVDRTPVSYLGLNDLYLDTCGPTSEIIDLSLKEDATIFLQSFAERLKSEDRRQVFIAKLGELLQVPYTDVEKNKLFHLINSDQLIDMHRRGVDIQLHTHRHRVTVAGADCLVQELEANRDWLEPRVGKTLHHFCYPNGLFDESNWPQLEQADIKSATTTESGFAVTTSHRYALPRIMDGEEVSDLEFEAEMSGFGQIKRQMFSWVLNTLNVTR